MKVLLTGATGFIGSRVAKILVELGCEVTALVRPGSNTWRIDDFADSISPLSCDLLSIENVQLELQDIKPDTCVHLAWYAEPGKYLDSLENISHLSASMILASILAKGGCTRFVGIGTCYEYDLRFTSRCLSEEDNTYPNSVYAAAKLGFYRALTELGRTSGMQVAWARPFYQYGPCEDKRRLIPYAINSLLQNSEAKVTAGEQVRDYLYIDDVASAICAITMSDLTGPVNVGSGVPIKVKEIVSTIAKMLGREHLLKIGALQSNPMEPKFVCAQNNKLIQGTRWSPHFSLNEGLSLTIDWWRAQLKSGFASSHS